MSGRSPSGEQFEISFEEQRAVVTEVGAGLRAYTVGDRHLLDGYDAGEMSPSGRGQVLIPWPNRIAEGSYEFGGDVHQLALDELGTQSAIHGLVRWSSWRETEREDHRVVLEHDLHPQPGYPFALALRIEYELSAEGLSVTTTATNVGARPCPYGAGAHPYLFPGDPTVDTATLRLPARSVLGVDAHGIPTGTKPVEGTEFDFREAKLVGATKLDTCFTDLERDGDGRAHVELASADGATRAGLWVGDAYPYLMVYTGDDRPDVRRRSMAVEPMTCPPQAFRTGEAIIVIEPGDSVEATWGVFPQ